MSRSLCRISKGRRGSSTTNAGSMSERAWSAPSKACVSAYVELGAAKIELMEPSRPDSPIAKFLERNPKGGIHHFCLSVDDVGKAAHAFAQNGVRLLGAGKPQRNVAGEPIAFVHPGDFLGALVELEEHKG